MKLIANIIRVLTGILFVFSGFIKLNDPVGFKIKLEEYFHVFAADLSPVPDTLIVSVSNPGLDIKEKYTSILNNEKQKTINFRTGNWEHLEVKANDGAILSRFDKTTFYINLDGQDILKKEIQKEGVAPSLFAISVSVSGKQILAKSISVYNNVPINISDNIDVSPYIKAPGWLVKMCNRIIPFCLFLAIFICTFEVVLGIALLIGWRRNLTLWLLALMILFFTFLTWYSATYNKVTDCGCFGNAIPLTPWQSFIKDLLLSGFIIILVILRKYIKPVFSAGFSWGVISVFAVSSVVFSIYCWFYLPVFNFLKFKVGNDIEKMTSLPPGAKEEKREMMFIYSRDGKDFEFTADELSEKKILDDPKYVFKIRIDKVLQEGDKPEIHDFVMHDADGADHLGEFFEKDEYKLLMVSEGLERTRPRAMKKIAKIAKDWTEKSKLEFWAITSGAPEKAEAIRHEYQFQFKFYFGDNTNLKSIIRSNPGLLLFKKSTVIATWPSTDLPGYKELQKVIK